MANYLYKVINKDGKEKKGTIVSDSRDKAVLALKSEGNTIISVEEGSVLNTEIKFGTAKLKSKDLSVFCRQFYSLLVAGVAVVPSLNMLAEQTENKNLKQATKRL